MPTTTQRSTTPITPTACLDTPCHTPRVPGNSWQSLMHGGAPARTEAADPWGGLLGEDVFSEVDPLTAVESLFATPELAPDQVAEARARIAALPEAEQAPWYRELQRRTGYHNQRDNRSLKEESDGGTCNLTAVAMALQVLGITSPDPSVSLDDYLIQRAAALKLGLTVAANWAVLAGELGAEDRFLTGGKRPRAWWESQVRDGWLAQGYGVVASIRGHVVRVQDVTADGVVVDDPYGRSVLRPHGRDDNNAYSFVAVNGGFRGDTRRPGDLGDDNLWPWADVLDYDFNYFTVYAPGRG